MKQTISKFKDTVISGIVLFLPIFVVIMIFKKLYSTLYKSGHKLTEILGMDNAGDKKWVPFITLCLVVFLFYIFGLMVRFTMVTKVKEWIENNILIFIPTYSKYKAKMMSKLQPEEEKAKEPILVAINDAWKPGFLMNTNNGKSTVFLPSTPDSDNGEVWIVDESKVTFVDMTEKEFKNSLLLSGRGMKTEKSNK